MPPLNKTETLGRVTNPSSSQANPGGGPAGSEATNNSGIDSTQSPEAETNSSNTSQAHINNTISAAADSSDNRTGIPQPHTNTSNPNDIPQISTAANQPYANHHIYANSTTTTANILLNQMYSNQISSQSNIDLQQQHQLHQPQNLTQHSNYHSYLNSYEQFYQQQQQQQQKQQNSAQSTSQTQNAQQLDYITSNTNSLFSTSDYKQHEGVRYHPHLQATISGKPSLIPQNSSFTNAMNINAQRAPALSSASSSLISPRVVSSSSPSSSSNQIQISGNGSSGHSSSPNSVGSHQCKKCGMTCNNESELQEHITNFHGASPYGSSGYASSPYIKEEVQQQTPPSQSQLQPYIKEEIQQQTPPSQSQLQPYIKEEIHQQAPPSHSQLQPIAHQAANTAALPGEILDLDSQKMLYPPAQSPSMLHQRLGSTDSRHGLHNMQQRAGITTWDQQVQETLPPYLQQQQATDSKNILNNSPFYNSPKQSPYHVNNTANIVIKSEFPADTQQYTSDKSSDPASPNQQQMIPSSSPSEYPSTTTGVPQDNGQQNVESNQQFRGANFEPPSSSSAPLSTGRLGSKAANWKSNEPRRPKTYNCTACNKWFTSSGHLKRHYNTQLHKNAVKSSGQPDPSTLPISIHHHPARDPTSKSNRRGTSAAAVNTTNANARQRQHQPNPVHPPEPPNSPTDFGGPQVSGGGLTHLPHYTTTSSPNSMYQQQQFQQNQYMSQVQTTSNASPQHVSSISNPNLHPNQQETVMNGHPNALAGLSVPPTRQQTPMPSSQMRGLLNTMPCIPKSTQTTTNIIKNEHLEAVNTEVKTHLPEELERVVYLRTREVQQEGDKMFSLNPTMDSVIEKVEMDLLESESPQLHLMEAETCKDLDQNVGHHQITCQVSTLSQIPQYQQEQEYQADMDYQYLNISVNNPHINMAVQSHPIISHQQYQDSVQHPPQMAPQDIYTLTQTLPPQQLQHNTVEQQHFIPMPLDTLTQQLRNNMPQRQQPISTGLMHSGITIHTSNMGNMLPHNHHHMQQPQHTEQLQPANMQLHPETTNFNIPSHITTINNIQSRLQLHHPDLVPQPPHNTPTSHHTIIETSDGQIFQVISSDSTTATGLHTSEESRKHGHPQSPQAGDLPPSLNLHPSASHFTTNINNMQSHNQLQHQTLVQQPSNNTMSSRRTIIGKTGVCFRDAYYTLVSSTNQQLVEISDGQLPQVTPSDSTAASCVQTASGCTKHMPRLSPQAGDLPPLLDLPSMADNYHQDSTFNVKEISSSSSSIDDMPTSSRKIVHKPTVRNNEQPKNSKTTTIKSMRNQNYAAIDENNFDLPSAGITCKQCNKVFTRSCYLTQHNKSLHCGEYPFRCEHCGKRYQLEDVYYKHVLKHSIAKDHKCELCTKEFWHKPDLLRHIESIHDGKKKHVCDICQKGFSRQDHLRKHLLTHTRARRVGKNKTRMSTNIAVVEKKKPKIF